MKIAAVVRPLVPLLLLSVVAGAAHAQVYPTPPRGIMRPTFELQLRDGVGLAEMSSHSLWSYVGHSHANHAGPSNPWNLYVGTWDPGAWTSTSAQWDFDDMTGLGAGDSLQGWWPVRLAYRETPGPMLADDTRPWSAVDHGNQLSARPVNAGHPRTFGVVSAWHADPGNLAGGVPWSPLAGARSMWCGLRALGDDAVLDPVTQQPYNEAAVQFNTWATATTPAPTFRAYPGYGNQWDQMLYRDVVVAEGAPLALSFLYRTRMSTACPLGVGERTGWFHGDPLSMQAGNFISASAAGANAPRDSFSVYIGVPVNDAACVYTDPTISPAPVWDPQRRWFDEVLRIDAPYYELLGLAGAHPAQAFGAPMAYAATIPWADPGNGDANVSALYGAPGNAAHLARLVFRVKTNVAYSDDDAGSGNGAPGGGFSSEGWGAVLLDDVAVNGTTYGFEGANGGVDNTIGVPASTAWKSTGKPPASYVHPVDINSDVTWNDVCGLPGASTSLCHLGGIVVSIGNADQSGAIADGRWPGTTEAAYGMVSPTLNLVAPADGTPNAMGITRDMAACSEDMYLLYELNFAAFVLPWTGTLWEVGCQAYPARSASGHDTWSDIVVSPSRYYQSFQACMPDLVPLKGNGVLRTSKGNGIPDSVRVYIGITSECFAFGGTCNSTDGGYFDNVAVVLANRPGGDPIGPLRSDLWQFFNDAFPVNGYASDNVAPGTPAFDTTTALVKGPVNLAPWTGDPGRCDVLADSIVVCAPNASGADAAVRVDLVFRILPGPGNFKAVPGRTFPPTPTMQLLRVPTDQANLVTAGDGSFWGEYIAHPGAFASPNAHAGGKWDYLAWNSARCDTLETNLFPVAGRASSGVDPAGGFYQSTYHESDPHFGTLGIPKGRCFLIDPAGPANSTNIACDPAWNAANLAWSLVPGTGFDGAWTTKEYTKIIPDGLLTPGSHVEYFFRKQRASGSGTFVMDPDTTNISPQLSEGNFDGHRWQQFGVLPDRWKGTEFGGPGMTCMLYVDNDDRRGDELVWVSVMDTIGGTSSSKWGAHDGWHATGHGFGLYNQTNPDIAQAFVQKNAQPGTVWDVYGVKASESGPTGGAHIGSRYAPQPTGLMAGKGAAIGPRKAWLRTYYRMVSWLTGDLNGQNIGPVPNIGEDDIGLVKDFLAESVGTWQPRALLVQGDGFAEQCDANGGVHLDFLNNNLFCGLRDASYTDLTPGLVSCPDLLVAPTVVPGGTVFGLPNSRITSDDVLDPGFAEAQSIVDYQAVGVNAPYRAAVEHAPTTAHDWLSVTAAWDLRSTRGRYCTGDGCAPSSRNAFYSNLLVNVFGTFCGIWSPWLWRGSCYTAVPAAPGAPAPTDFLRVGNSLVRSGDAVVHFGAARAGRVRIRLYDVAGRAVRTLADRTVEAGEHDARWDGRDDAGNAAPRGVYFTRIDYADGGRIAGRIVFLK